MLSPRTYLSRTLASFSTLLGKGLIVSIAVIVLIGLLLGAATLLFMNAAAPTTMTIASGPPGSNFQKIAERYRDILAKEGVTLKILPSAGSMDNFRQLSNPRLAVDVGFVLGGEVDGADIGKLMSLGSISYQPLMVFYRGRHGELLTDFKGRRIDIGKPGSGTNTLALALLKANDMDPGRDIRLVDTSVQGAEHALQANQVDAIFVMGDSSSSATLRELLRTPDIHLLNFSQADGYTRRINYLNKLELPKGSLDFGRDIPASNMQLIGPTVELIARKGLHPALSDLLLEAAQTVHGSASLFKKRGEFPAAIEHEFPISPDATRYYTTGKGFLYRTFPFWVASLIARGLAVIVPVILLLIPGLQIAPTVYRWRNESRIYNWYRVLLQLERDALKTSVDDNRREELLRHLAHIETTVNRINVPPSCGNLFFTLREHISFVRERILAQEASDKRDIGDLPR